MTAYIYKIRKGVFMLQIKSKNKIIFQKDYVSIASAMDEAKHCTPGNY
jgi:hypothetical protein